METKPTIDYEKVLRDSGMPTTETDISMAFAKVVDEAGLVTNTSRMSPFWRLINTIVTRPVLWLKAALINVTLKKYVFGDCIRHMVGYVCVGRQPET